MKRSSGILLPVSALPSPYGIGTLGKAAFTFVDFLEKAGQRYWQMLPLGPTGFGDSPYQCVSSFAGNPYFIDLDLLVRDELLTHREAVSLSFGSDPKEVNYGALYFAREQLLRKAFSRSSFAMSKSDSGEASAPTCEAAPAEEDEDACGFVERNTFWLEDYALFMALKGHFGMRSWQNWEDDAIRHRAPEALAKYRELLREDILYHSFVQFVFYKQWNALKKYAAEKGISFIGDLPIYVPLDSAEVWVDPQYFQLDERLVPTAVSGVPPDCFTAEGQLWGSPLYKWDVLKEDGYSWWRHRLAAAVRLFDVIRIDHFRGFEDYWSIPYGSQTAEHGEWMQGPGMDFIHVIKKTFPDTEFIAEDLGCLTENVRNLVTDSGFPGMKVMQFAFEGAGCSDYLPHNFHHNNVVYTGTHDNNTAWGWLLEADSEELRRARDYLGLSRKEGWDKGFIRGGMSSVADLFIAQMQDYLELSGWARMNRPGTIGNNWKWRLEPAQLTEELAHMISKITKRYER